MKIVNGYKVYTKEELAKILEDHAKWLKGDGGNMADLSRADLSGADLSRADLSGADLSRASLSGADLSGSKLSGADVSMADLSAANLSAANMSGADMSMADLSRADLSRASLFVANLYWADLSGAVLDYSVFPLWCGGSKFKCSAKLVYQLLAHIITLEVTDEKEEFEKIKKEIENYAKKSHRWYDLTK